MRELWRGEAGASECDAAGRLAPAAALAKASEALAALSAELGVSNLESPRATSALLVRRVDVASLAEARAGATLVVQGGVTGFEESRLAAGLVLRDARGGAPAAGFAIHADHVETAALRVFPWAARTREAARAVHIDAPPETRLAELGEAPPDKKAALAEPDAPGVSETGRGVFRAAEADAFARVRLEALLARMLEGEAWTDHAADGGAPARLEMRLAIRAYPAPGDRYVVRAGLAAVRGARWRELRWLCDPGRGSVWASLASACAWINAETRAPGDPPESVRAALAAAAGR
jgi:acyl-CoA thioester hydrolase